MQKIPTVKNAPENDSDDNNRNTGSAEKEKQEAKKSINADSSKPELMGIETFIQLIKDGKVPGTKFNKKTKGINEDSGYNNDNTNHIKP